MEFDDFLLLVGENLMKARHARGLTREQAAEGRGAVRYLWELETGRRNPSLQMIFTLAERYGVTPADLVSVPEARPSKKYLSDLKVEAPKPGRKPKGHPGAR